MCVLQADIVLKSAARSTYYSAHKMFFLYLPRTLSIHNQASVACNILILVVSFGFCPLRKNTTRHT